MPQETLEMYDTLTEENKNAVLSYVAFLSQEQKKANDKNSRRVDLSRFVIPTERGQNADKYIREIRDNGRF